MSQALCDALSQTLEPLCPRDSHVMAFEARRIRWTDESEGQVRHIPSYHCDYEGCSVRYNLKDGYFTVIDTPELSHFLEALNLTSVSGCVRRLPGPHQRIYQLAVQRVAERGHCLLHVQHGCIDAHTDAK